MVFSLTWCVRFCCSLQRLIILAQDGTLTDSIAAVEAAWTLKAQELGLEPTVVIAATHGRRASDNLLELVPGMKKEHVDGEVDRTLATHQSIPAHLPI